MEEVSKPNGAEEAVNILKFTNVDFGNVGVVTRDNKIWFIGIDIAAALGYENVRDAVYKRVFSEYKLRMRVAYAGQRREITFINEAGIYQLIFGSKLKSAMKFQRWIFEDVIPSIRKYGAFLNLKHPDVRKMSISVRKAFASALHCLNTLYNIDKIQAERVIAILTNQIHDLIGIERGCRNITSADKLLKLIIVESTFTNTINQGIADYDNERGIETYCEIINRCEDDAIRELERRSCDIEIATVSVID